VSIQGCEYSISVCLSEWQRGCECDSQWESVLQCG